MLRLKFRYSVFDITNWQKQTEEFDEVTGNTQDECMENMEKRLSEHRQDLGEDLEIDDVRWTDPEIIRQEA